jgi:hypothetical protein
MLTYRVQAHHCPLSASVATHPPLSLGQSFLPEPLLPSATSYNILPQSVSDPSPASYRILSNTSSDTQTTIPHPNPPPLLTKAASFPTPSRYPLLLAQPRPFSAPCPPPPSPPPPPSLPTRRCSRSIALTRHLCSTAAVYIVQGGGPVRHLEPLPRTSSILPNPTSTTTQAPLHPLSFLAPFTIATPIRTPATRGEALLAR